MLIFFIISVSVHLIACSDVHPAVVRRALQEDQLPLLDRLLDFPGLHGAPVSLPGHAVDPVGHQVLRAVQLAVIVVHSQGSLVLLLQIFPRLSELAQLPPAGLGGAAATDSVTLAESLHGLPDGHPARLAVVEGRQTPGLGARLSGVQELAGHLLSVPHIVAAPAPLPVRRRPPAASPGVALAVLSSVHSEDLTELWPDQSYLDGSLAAVPGDGLGHGRRRDGLDEGRLSVVVSLLPAGPEGRHWTVPDLRTELGSALLDGQLRSGSHAGCEGNIGLKRDFVIRSVVRCQQSQ